MSIKAVRACCVTTTFTFCILILLITSRGEEHGELDGDTLISFGLA